MSWEGKIVLELLQEKRAWAFAGKTSWYYRANMNVLSIINPPSMNFSLWVIKICGCFKIYLFLCFRLKLRKWDCVSIILISRGFTGFWGHAWGGRLFFTDMSVWSMKSPLGNQVKTKSPHHSSSNKPQVPKAGLSNHSVFDICSRWTWRISGLATMRVPWRPLTTPRVMQVWPLTQFFSVDFSQSRISIRKWS